MIEITFNELCCGSLKHAQTYGIGEYPGGFSFISYYNADGSIMTASEAAAAEQKAEAEEKAKWEAAVPLGGNPEEVFCLDLGLNIGDISELNSIEKRLNTFNLFPADHPNSNVAELERGTHELVLMDFERITALLKEGASTRVWYGDTANEKCGLMWLLWSLKNANAPFDNIFLLNAPTWQGTATGDWHKHISSQQKISEPFINDAIALWEKLMKENSLLRAVVDGKVMSVADDFYDEIIITAAKEMEETFRKSWLIGHLREQHPEVPDFWFFKRIEKLINDSIFTVVEEADEGWPHSFRYIKLS